MITTRRSRGAATLLHQVRLVRFPSLGAHGSGGLPAPTDVLVTGGRVTAVADRLDAPDVDQVLDGAGRWVIPGLWDAHVHLRQWAQNRTRLDLGGTGSAAEVTQRVHDHLTHSPDPTAALFGFGHRSATWPTPPTVAELDAVSGDHPVILTSGDAHNGWLNSPAYRLLGATAPTGALAENAWFALMPAITELAGRLTDDTAAIKAAVSEAAARGVVGITDFELALGLGDWPQRYAAGIDRLRVRAAVYPDGLEQAIAAGLRTGDPLPGTGGLATMGPLKIISDGSLNTRTALCGEPYADASGHDHPYGSQNYPPDELARLLTTATHHGLDVAVHAIGDAAVSIALDAYAATGARGSIEHAQLIRTADIARMAALGVRASVQPAHLLDDRDVTARLWPDRADRCFPLRSLHHAGVELALGSDAPVAPLDPWLAMAAAVHRSADDRDPWNPAEALTAAEALAASTDGQATLDVGSRGDLVLLDDDPLGDPGAGDAGDSAAAAAHLRNLKVAATLIAGRPTHLDL